MRGEMNVFARFFDRTVHGCSIIGLTFGEPGICKRPTCRIKRLVRLGVSRCVVAHGSNGLTEVIKCDSPQLR